VVVVVVLAAQQREPTEPQDLHQADPIAVREVEVVLQQPQAMLEAVVQAVLVLAVGVGALL
jgi:hypothetical protein